MTIWTEVIDAMEKLGMRENDYLKIGRFIDAKDGKHKMIILSPSDKNKNFPKTQIISARKLDNVGRMTIPSDLIKMGIVSIENDKVSVKLFNREYDEWDGIVIY